MPTKPNIQKLTATSADVLNVIRSNASPQYRSLVIEADAADAATLKTIGNVIMSYPGLQNEFLSALVNRIGRVMLTSKLYSSPISMLKKGMLEFGETVEEICVNIAKPHEFDPEVAETEVFKREIPDVRTAFHIMNFTKFYKATVSNDQLRQAFLSWSGITELIAGIVNQMYTAANYDEYQTMKYLLGKIIVDGLVYASEIDEVNATNMKGIVSVIKGASNNFEFLSPNYNMSGVMSYSMKNDQFLLIDSTFDATMDVEVLAAAFNMDKAEFAGHRVLIDGFGNIDNARLTELFADDENYTALTSEQFEALATIPAVLVDRNFFMMFDNFMNFTEQYNSQGLYWNYFYHTWKTFSVSPFSNAMLFVPGTPGVTSVTVSPDTASASVGDVIQLSATVVTTNFAPKTVTWSSGNANVTVDANGKVTIGAGASGSAVITATSTYDSMKSDTCTITIS